MVDKYLAIEMFEFSALSQVNSSILDYIYTMVDGLVIYAKARAFKVRATNLRPRSDNPKAKKFGLKAKVKD